MAATLAGAAWPAHLAGTQVDVVSLAALCIGCICGGIAAVIFSRMLRECGFDRICPCFFDEHDSRQMLPTYQTRSEKLARAASGSARTPVRQSSRRGRL